MRAKYRAGWLIDGPTPHMVGLDLPDPELAGALAGRTIQPEHSPTSPAAVPDGTFDLVLAIEVLEHVPDPAAALAELARVARRDLIVSVPREPIWRVANLARGKYVGAPGQYAGPRQPLVEEVVRLHSSASTLAGARRAQPVPVDDGGGLSSQPLNECAA